MASEISKKNTCVDHFYAADLEKWACLQHSMVGEAISKTRGPDNQSSTVTALN